MVLAVELFVSQIDGGILQDTRWTSDGHVPFMILTIRPRAPGPQSRLSENHVFPEGDDQPMTIDRNKLIQHTSNQVSQVFGGSYYNASQ